MRKFIVLLMAITVFSCSMGNEVESVASRYYDAMKEDNIDVMRALLDDTKWFSLNPGTNIGLKGYELGAAKIEGEMATISTVTIADSGFRGNFDTVLVNKNGEWLINHEETLKNEMKAAKEAKKIEMNMDIKITPAE